MKRRFAIAFVQMICIAIVAFSGIKIVRTDIINGLDLIGYYTAATIANNGDGSSLYDINLQKAVQSALIFPTKMRGGLLPFEYPLWALLPFLPLARLPHRVAYLVWLSINIGLFFLGLNLVVSSLPAISSSARRLALIYLAATTFFLVITVFILGQLTFLMFLGYALCFLALRKGNWFRAGLALALTLLKPQLVIALPLVLLWKRRWRALLGFGSGLGGLAAISVFFIGVPRLHDYISISKFAAERHDWSVDMSWTGLFQSLTGSMPLAFALGTAMGVFVLSLLLLAWKDKWSGSEAFDLRYALAVPVSLLVSPHLFGHDLTLLIIPALLALNHACAAATSDSGRQLAKVTAWVCAGYLVEWVRIFPIAFFGARLEILFLIASCLALLKMSVGWSGQATPAKLD